MDSSDDWREGVSMNREDRITGDASPTITYASLSIESLKVTNEGNWSSEREVVDGVVRKNVFPYELSDAVLEEKDMEEKERVMESESCSVERRSR